MSRLQTLVKVAVVTGGATGLGAAIAQKLAMAGVKEVRVLSARDVPEVSPLSYVSGLGYGKSRGEKREERQRSRVPQKMQSMAAKARR